MTFIVAPHRGAWIETPAKIVAKSIIVMVAPHRGAWIETIDIESLREEKDGRTPQGCVD